MLKNKGFTILKKIYLLVTDKDETVIKAKAITLFINPGGQGY